MSAAPDGSPVEVYELLPELGEGEIARIEDGVVHGEVTYKAHGRSWRHAFAMRVFSDESELGAVLQEVGFRLDRWLDRERGWFVARAG